MPDANTETRDRWPDWAVILLLSLFHLTLTSVLMGIGINDALAYQKSSVVVEVTGRALLFPLYVADAWGLELPVWGAVLLLPNSLLYGILWWFTWRLYRLTFRSRPVE